MPRDEDYSRKKLERLMPIFYHAAVKGVREVLDDYPRHGHKHRTNTRRSIVRDHIVDHLRADLMTDPEVSIKEKNPALCIKSTKVKGAFSRTSPRGDSLLTYGNGLNFSTTEYCLRHEGRYASGRCDRGATGCGHCYQRCGISSAKLRGWLAHREFSSIM